MLWEVNYIIYSYRNGKKKYKKNPVEILVAKVEEFHP